MEKVKKEASNTLEALKQNKDEAERLKTELCSERKSNANHSQENAKKDVQIAELSEKAKTCESLIGQKEE